MGHLTFPSVLVIAKLKNFLDLNLKLKQKLRLTPQMIQSISLLQLSNLDLLNHIETELAENPLLEGEPPSNVVDIDSTAVMADAESPAYEWVEYMEDASDLGVPKSAPDDREDTKRKFLEGALGETPVSLYEHLHRQLRIACDSEKDIEIGEHVLAYLNKDGYLTHDAKEIAQESEIPEEDIRRLIGVIQAFEPSGVAGRTIEEVLLLQLRAHTPRNTLAEEIIETNLKLLSEKNYKKLAKEHGATEEEVAEAVQIISSCEPYPGRQYDNTKVKYIVPDIRFKKVKGEWQVILIDDFLPQLSISKRYQNLIRKPNTKEELNKYLSEKMTTAVSLIQAIEQRRRTLYKVGKALLELQPEFFEKGRAHLRPMILRDVAERIEMSESTVSRISNNKFAETDWGILPIKFFFSASVKSEGGTTSKQAVKEVMKKIIEESDARLSDEKIKNILNDRGIQIARRTVAKYRKELKILSSRDR